MFQGQPKGLYALALANTGERFGYYTMLAVFTLFLKDNFAFSEATAGIIYSVFLGLVYFLPLFGGMLADKFGYGKMVTIGISIMFLGYLILSIPLGNDILAIGGMALALLLVCLGTGLFKGNLQVLVGNLYEAKQYSTKRDSGFQIFYMAINIGALFAATAAVEIMRYMQENFGVSKEDSYHFAFAVACFSLIVSIAIYYFARKTFVHADYNNKTQQANSATATEELSKSETKERIVALCLVFAVVIFFWMAFHQNGSTLTFFAEQYTATVSTGVESMLFDVINLVLCIIIVYGLFGLFQSSTGKGRAISAGVIALCAAGLVWKYNTLPAETIVDAPIFQQFNPCFVVALTPVSMAIFGALAKKGKEPSAPLKIGLGMLVAAVAYCLLTIVSIGLPDPEAQKAAGESAMRISPNYLITTYLVLTFAELLLSPIGISFVSKVAPPKYKGMMMGGWFVATAIGNLLVSIPSLLWGQPLVVVWGVLAALCLISASFIFIILKKLNRVA
ncbi:MAG: peptide MFS transporter [Bacteroides sp.]|nr:peptide MFS transporter [Roseburia sp.]MCM1346951.1 peptide MFS transporter [Bacteroides sp.]MCM1421489.1 peptide MFS transporter [Bacteroides sp.]